MDTQGKLIIAIAIVWSMIGIVYLIIHKWVNRDVDTEHEEQNKKQ